MNASKARILVVLLLCLALGWYSFFWHTNPSWIREGIKEWKDAAGEIVFYGKIIDQFANPVENALVSVDAPIPVGYQKDKPRKRHVQTDRNGCFKVAKSAYDFKGFKGGNLFVDEIKKDGYEYIRGTDQVMSFSYAKNDPNRFNPEKNRPIVFHMRKKEAAPTFLFQDMDLQFDFSTNGLEGAKGYDFIRRQRIDNMNDLMFDYEPLVCDILVKASFRANDATWIVVVSPGNTNGGIVSTNQLLYEAPSDGYRAQYTFVPDDRQAPKDNYLYLRSRAPAIYSRFEIEYINADKEFFRLSGKYVTNPYGDRNLEQATDFPYEVYQQLTDEARAALRKNTYPAKPDLPKLIKAAKKK